MKFHVSFPRHSISFALIALLAVGCAKTPPLREPTPLALLSGNAECSKCAGYLLPGSATQSPRTVYRIDSDLPELFTSNGVLYSTRAILPPFQTKDGAFVPDAMRVQRNAGFHAIDASFEVFLYHLSREHAPNETRRIVIHVKNIGAVPAIIRPRQSMFHGPNAANGRSVEVQLGEAVMQEKWDVPIDKVEVAPGESAIVGYTKQLRAANDTDDATRQEFVTGILRADVESGAATSPQLEVTILSIPGDADHSTMLASAESLLDVGARSGEDAIDMTTAPSGCQVRRVVGTARNALWQSAPVRFDVAKLPSDDVFFPMASFGVQTPGCDESRQSVELLLHPPYVHNDSVGNYMMEYLVTMTLANGGPTERAIDVMFGKTDAPIGLTWQIAVGENAESLAGMEKLPIKSAWAGLHRVDGDVPWYRATLLPDGPLVLPPNSQKTITLRLMVLGTSSLPWQLHLVPVTSAQ